MPAWSKIGRVFDPRDWSRDWMYRYAQAPSTLVMPDRLRVFFSCRPRADKSGRYVSHAAYVDFDRNDLWRVLEVASRPVMPLGGTGEFDEFGTYPISVIPDRDGLVAYYGGWTRCESVPFDVAIGMARSRDDGKTFTKVGRGPVLAKSLTEPFVISGPKIRRFGRRWYLWYIAGKTWIVSANRPEPVYRIRLAVSSDGRYWQRLGRDLIEPVYGEYEAQASPDVFSHDGRFHMFFCYRYGTDYRNRDRGYRIGYAVSEDLIQWERRDSEVGIDVSTGGWDGEMLSYPHVFALDGEVYMLYLGNAVGRHGFGAARLQSGLS